MPMAKRRTVLTFYLWLSLSLEDVFSGCLFKSFFVSVILLDKC